VFNSSVIAGFIAYLGMGKNRSLAAISPTATEATSELPHLLIVTTRQIHSERGQRNFVHFIHPTQNKFNIVFNRQKFNQSDRYMINETFTDVILAAGSTINIMVHGFNTGWEDSIALANDFFEGLGKRENDLDILFNWTTESVGNFDKGRGNFWFKNMSETALMYAFRLPLDIFQEYLRSVDQISVSAEKLTNLIETLHRTFPEKKINLFAHSMGGKIAMQAIHSFYRQNPNTSENAIAQLVLASPDIDYQEFNRLFARVSQVCGRTTLYVSPRDLALYLANRVRERRELNDNSRVGVPKINLKGVRRKHIDYITYKGGRFQVNHTFFTREKCVLNDIAELFSIKKGSARRADDREIGKKLYRVSATHDNVFKLRAF